MSEEKPQPEIVESDVHSRRLAVFIDVDRIACLHQCLLAREREALAGAVKPRALPAVLAEVKKLRADLAEQVNQHKYSGWFLPAE